MMGKDWKIIKNEIDAENNRILHESPEDIVRVFKYDIVNTGAGTGGLMLGTWFEGATASRYIGAYYIYNIIKLASVPGFGMEETKEMLNLMLPKAVETAKLCGMEIYARFSDEVMECVNGMDNIEDILTLLNSLYLYGSNMNAWIHHYMKWGIGQAFKIKAKEELNDMGARAGESYL